jgi:hypothetical protein
LDDVENDLKKMDISGWRKITRNREVGKLILKEAKALLGPQS